MLKAIFLSLTLATFSATVADQPEIRPTHWAQPVINSDLKNFYCVSDTLYRSAQPDDDEMQALAKLGFKSILNLRHWHSDEDEAEDTDLKLYQVKMNAGSITADEVLEALKIIQNAPKPILIHCWHGSDRTGTVTAAYRLVFQDWSKAEATKELTEGQFGYHSIYKNIPELIKQLDVPALKKALKLDQ